MQYKEVAGGICAPKGFAAAGVHCGIRANHSEKYDLALIKAEVRCAAAGVYTTNKVCGAPIKVDRAHLADGYAQAIVVNSGNANTCAANGVALAEECCTLVGKALNIDEKDVLPASTGVIGQPMVIDPFARGIPAAAEKLAATAQGSTDAATAIMTTDTHKKEYAIQFELGGKVCTVGAIGKGSGMIAPNMATMLAFYTTDAAVSPALLEKALKTVVPGTYNQMSVDLDTSTNDTCVLFASGKAAAASAPLAGEDSVLYAEFCQALNAVTQKLARKMASDGEGATKLVTVTVRGAANDAEADLAARTVANSPLVKTAIYGHDANWGRIAGALGRSGAKFAQENVDIDIMGMPVLRDGLPVPFSEEEALRRFEADEIVLEASLGAGDAETTVWTCDFSHEYVSINGDYRS